MDLAGACATVVSSALPAGLGLGGVERDADEMLGTWFGGGGAATSSHGTWAGEQVTSHLPSLACASFPVKREDSGQLYLPHGSVTGKKRMPAREGLWKSASKKAHYHSRVGLKVSRQTPRQAFLCESSLHEMSTDFKVPVPSLLIGIAESLPRPSGTNSK